MTTTQSTLDQDAEAIVGLPQGQREEAVNQFLIDHAPEVSGWVQRINEFVQPLPVKDSGEPFDIPERTAQAVRSRLNGAEASTSAPRGWAAYLYGYARYTVTAGLICEVQDESA